MARISTELSLACMDEAEKWSQRYSAFYNQGGENYEAKMKHAARMILKWEKRSRLVQDNLNPRLQNALLEILTRN